MTGTLRKVNLIESESGSIVIQTDSLEIQGQLSGDGSIVDAIGNEFIAFVRDVSEGGAVNHITIKNATVGVPPAIIAEGDEANISLSFSSKGSGVIILDGLKWPQADGNAGEAIITDGASNLSFGAVAGAGAELLFATVKLTGDEVIAGSTNVAIPWDAEIDDVGEFWNIGDPTYFTVPAEVSKVKLSFNARSSNEDFQYWTQMNDVNFDGMLFVGSSSVSGDPVFRSGVSAIIDVVEGDTFRLMTRSVPGGNVLTDAATWFSIEAITGAGGGGGSFTGFDMAFYISGSPLSSQISGQFVAVRNFDLPINLTGSLGISAFAATASTDFDIQKNGVSIGTMNFGIAATTATFTFAGGVSFTAGDILRIIAPVVPDGTLSDISMTFKGTRT